MKRAWGVLLAVCLASCGDPFEAGLKKARAHDATAEGKAYVGPLTQQFAPELQRAMKGCFPNSASIPEADFAIVFAIRADGSPAQLMVRPESPATKCVLDGITALRLPTPPQPDWWVVVDVKTTP